MSYRSEEEFDEKFGRGRQGDEWPLAGGRYAVESYLDHHADKLAWRFDAGSYVALTDAMSTRSAVRVRRSVVIDAIALGSSGDHAVAP